MRPGLLLAIMIVLFMSIQGSANAAPYTYITNMGSNNISVIDTVNDRIIASIKVGENPYAAAVSPDGTKVYVASWNNGKDGIYVIDTAKQTVSSIINVGSGTSGAVVSPDGRKAYILSSSRLYVVDTATDTIITSIYLGNAEARDGIDITPDGTKLYISYTGARTPNNFVAVIDTVTNSIISTIKVDIWPDDLVVSPDGTKIYVTHSGGGYPDTSNTVSVIDTNTNTVISKITVGDNPGGIALTPDGTRAYVSSARENNVYVIDTAMKMVIAKVDVGYDPLGVAITPDGRKAYVLNIMSNNVSVIDTITNRVISTIKVGTYPAYASSFIQRPVRNRLDIVSDNITLVVGIPTNVTFYVASEGVPVKGATVLLTRNATGIGITNDTGIAIISVNASAIGVITATANATGYINGTAIMNGTMPAPTPMPTPIPTAILSTTFIPTPTLQASNNSSRIFGEVALKAAPPLASITVSALVIVLWTMIEKLLLFLLSGVKKYMESVYTATEKKIRKVTVVRRIPLFFGLSSIELLVVIVSALLLGGAFAYARNELWILKGFLIFVVIAGFTSVAHELAHWYVARRYKKDVEYKFWGIGTITLIVTSLLRYPFASPSRTLINDSETLDKKAMGLISLAGPVVSIVLSIPFLLMIAYGHSFDGIGIIGFNLGMMTCVYQLMPIKPLEGVRVFEWNRLIWGIVFIPALLFYLGMLVFVIS